MKTIMVVALVAAAFLAGLLLANSPSESEPQPDLGCSPRYDFQSLDTTVLCADRIVTAQFVGESIKGQASIYLPPQTPQLRAIIVVTEGGGLGHTAFATGVWRAMCDRLRCALLRYLLDGPDASEPSDQIDRNAATGSGSVLLELLDSLAANTGLTTLKSAPLLFWGFSAAGSYGATFAAWQPDRTAGFIRYHSHLRNVQLDTSAVVSVPALMIVGADDETAGVDDSREFWSRGRSRGAPWSFAIQAGPHYSLQAWDDANELTWRWIDGVLRERASVPGVLSTVQNVGLQSDPLTGQIMDDQGGLSSARTLNWFPDSATVGAWVRLTAAR